MDPSQDNPKGGGNDHQDGEDQKKIDPKKGDSKSADPKKADGGDGGEKSGDDPPYITPERLTSVLEARQRKQEATLKEFRSGLKEEFDELRNTLTELAKPKQPEQDQEKKESQKIIELQRQLDQVEARAAKAEERAKDEAEARKNDKVESRIKDALTAAGCHSVLVGLRAIKPELTVSEDGSKIFVTVKSDYGEEDLDLDAYIQREFKENICPWLFKGSMRSGSPAEGDAGDGKTFQFTKEQAFDPKLYLENPEKYRAAFEQGMVKGVKKPTS